MREIWSKQAQVLHIQTCSYELQLNWSFGETSLPSFSIMWTTRELAMMALQNELHTRTTLDRRWTYTRLENRSSPKGGHGGAIWTKLGACDTPKINASVKGKNWGLQMNSKFITSCHAFKGFILTLYIWDKHDIMRFMFLCYNISISNCVLILINYACMKQFKYHWHHCETKVSLITY